MRKLFFLILLLLGIFLLVSGLLGGAFLEVFKAGSLLCLSCMGLG
ncbi:MAG: hypothetical protein ABIK99_02375 [candidate division WOR-3 bacterium]